MSQAEAMFEARVFHTDWGYIGAVAGRRGLVRLTLPCPAEADCQAALGEHAESEAGLSRLLDQVEREIGEYLAGRRRSFTLPIDLTGMPVFRRRVLEQLREIGHGQYTTYGALAKAVGTPRATRAVGGAMATNPLSLIIPCHRVLASGGRLNGFAGGLALKQRLLELEGLTVDQGRVVKTG
ncbi:MAG: methylated-DNA--[protein]-cysteine S-methyltransferase [Bacillota bacterium]